MSQIFLKGAWLHVNNLESPVEWFAQWISICHECICAISLLSLLGMGHDTSFKQLKYPWTKNTVPRVEIDSVVLWFWKGRYLYFVDVFMLFPFYLPLKKVNWSYLNPLHQMILCAKFGWKSSVVLENKMKMWKLYNGPWLTTDKAQLSLQLCKVSKKLYTKQKLQILGHYSVLSKGD